MVKRRRFWKLRVFMHPMRLKIMTMLADAGEMHLSRIARKLRISKKNAKVHMDFLQRARLVKSRYRRLGGATAKFYRLNEGEVRRMLQEAMAMLAGLEEKVANTGKITVRLIHGESK